MNTALDGGIFETPGTVDDLVELRQLVTNIGVRSLAARVGASNLVDVFDASAWRHLEEAGLTRLSSSPESGSGPNELALVLCTLARHFVTVPLGENDVLGGWLVNQADVDVPDSGPLTVAVGDVTDSALTVPYAHSSSAVILALRAGGDLLVSSACPADLTITAGYNLGGEPRDVVHIPRDISFVTIDAAAELTRRGAWVRCMQTIGALDAAVESSVAHCRDRVQFGRPLSAFQAVQHTLASMAGEVERARAAATLAVAAATVHGFDSAPTDYAVTVAKIVVGQVVPVVIRAAHQLHGAIGVTHEHRLRLATMRARCWATEFGDTAWYARRLGRMALAPGIDPWDLIIGQPSAATPY